MTAPILDYAIHYTVGGGLGFLEKLRNFVITLGGWTVDAYGGAVYDADFRIYSNGLNTGQGLLYNFDVHSFSGSDDRIRKLAIYPTSRYSNPTDNPWNVADKDDYLQYCCVSAPVSNFTALYLFGNSYFVTAILHVHSTAVIHIPFGTINLLRSWIGYTNNFAFHFQTQNWGDGTSTYSWSNMTDNTSKWFVPYSYMSTGSNSWGLLCTVLDAIRKDIDSAGFNHEPSSTSGYASTTGKFNVPAYLGSYNAYTNKRGAYQPVCFVKNETTTLWYPIGIAPFIYLNGTGLNIGDIVTYGTEEYMVFPCVYTAYNLWVGFRIA